MNPHAPNWVDQSYPYYELLRILNIYLDVECYIIDVDHSERWHEIRRHRRAAWPVDFDYFFGLREDRDRYNREKVREVAESGHVLVSHYGELASIFVPVLHEGRVAGILQSGVFFTAPPDREMMLREWRRLAGFEPWESNPVFYRYVRCLLECPCLEGELLSSYQEVLEAYAAMLSGKISGAAAARITEKLRLTVFSKRLKHLFWLDLLVKNNRNYPPTWGVGKVTPWEFEEMGIEKIPTNVLVLRLVGADGGGRDNLDQMVQGYHFQREMMQFTRTLPDSLLSTLEDGSVAVLSAPRAAPGSVQEKLEILDRIDEIAKFVKGRFDSRILTGVDRAGAPAQNLFPVFRRALLALGACDPLNRSTLFYEDIRTNPSVSEPTRYYELARQLIEACVKGSVRQIEACRERYLEKIVLHSGGNPEILRLHLLYSFGQMIESLRRRIQVAPSGLETLSDTFERNLQEASSLQEIIDLFRDSLSHLVRFALRPLDVSQDLRMEAARRYLDENFSENLTLEQVARTNGFSVSVFSRGFKKKTGVGFSAYLQKKRIDHAKHLLLTTELSVARVSAECGYNNLSYFFGAFKRFTGKTPLAFRSNPKLKIPGRI
jgi:AraC-like DNA-binding protein